MWQHKINWTYDMVHRSKYIEAVSFGRLESSKKQIVGTISESEVKETPILVVGAFFKWQGNPVLQFEPSLSYSGSKHVHFWGFRMDNSIFLAENCRPFLFELVIVPACFKSNGFGTEIRHLFAERWIWQHFTLWDYILFWRESPIINTNSWLLNQ